MEELLVKIVTSSIYQQGIAAARFQTNSALVNLRFAIENLTYFADTRIPGTIDRILFPAFAKVLVVESRRIDTHGTSCICR